MSLANPPLPDGPSAVGASNLLARLLSRGRPLVMGILNVTPDSFSDGGRFLDPDIAIAHGRRMAAEERRYHRHRRRIHPSLRVGNPGRSR